jgi:hypothetical protein
VATKTVKYRGYQFVIQPPITPEGQWRVLIWPPGRASPIPMPTFASEDDTIQAAQGTVDRELDGPNSTPTAA